MTNDETLLARLRSFYDAGACLLDEMELEQWAEQFAEDGRYEVIARENYDQGLPHATIYCDGIGMIRDRVTAIREAIIAEDRSLRHMISSVRVNKVDADAVHAQASFLLIEALSDRVPEMILLGRYIDVLEDRGTGFAIRHRRCVYDNYWLPRAIIVPV